MPHLLITVKIKMRERKVSRYFTASFSGFSARHQTMLSLTLDRWFAIFATLSPALPELSGPVTEDYGDTLLGGPGSLQFFLLSSKKIRG
jgi:hypothetical protein